MMKDIQKEFDKHPISIPVNADTPELRVSGDTYNGPIINITGDNAQLAWDNTNVSQSTTATAVDIAAGFEPLSQAVVNILRQVRASGLALEDIAEVESSGNEILREVIKENPDKGAIRRSVTYVKGLLVPLLSHAAEGAGDGIHGWAEAAVESLGTALSSAFQS